MIKIRKHVLAIVAETEAIPVNPNTPAIIASIKNKKVKDNMINLHINYFIALFLVIDINIVNDLLKKNP
ncbi:MAG: hypothetical protein ACK5Z5_05335 [Neisseriaceae bacterium]